MFVSNLAVSPVTTAPTPEIVGVPKGKNKRVTPAKVASEVALASPTPAASMSDLRAGFPALFAEIDCATIARMKSKKERDSALILVFTRYALMCAHSGIGLKDKAMADMATTYVVTKDGKPSKTTAKWFYCKDYALQNPRMLAGESLGAYQEYAASVQVTLHGLVFPEPLFAENTPAENTPAENTPAENTSAGNNVNLERIKGMTLSQLEKLELATLAAREKLDAILRGIATEREKHALV